MLDFFSIHRKCFLKEEGMRAGDKKIKTLFITYIWNPTNDSAFWFAVFFTAIVLIKFSMFHIGVLAEFQISINDVIISSLGFVNVFMIKFSKCFFKYKNDI